MVDKSGVNGDVPGQADDTEYLTSVFYTRDNVLLSPEIRGDNTEPWSQPPILLS